jgi:DNA repair exonuclease SbcCD nuclease subunit
MSQVSAGKGTAPVAFYDTAGKIIHHSRLCGLEAHSFARHSARFGRCVDLRGGERASASDWYGSLVCGDFTDFGLPGEAVISAEDIKAHVRIPVIGVVGNHDFESGKIAEVQSIIEEAEVSFTDHQKTELACPLAFDRQAILNNFLRSLISGCPRFQRDQLNTQIL